MFVVIADISIKPESLSDFKKWFSDANKIISKYDGFVSRRLLETRDGKHRVVVEFESLEKFSQMHKSKEHEQVHSQAIKYMDTLPDPKFYNVVAE